MSVRGLMLGLVASASLVVPAVSFAHDTDRGQNTQASRIERTDTGMDDAVRSLEKLSDPRMQRDMGNVLSALVSSLMNLRVGEIANAVQDMDIPNTNRGANAGTNRVRKMDPRTTLADLASKGDPDFADKLDDNVRAMPKMAGAMAGTLAQMLPMIDAMARDFEAQIGQTMRKAKDAR